MCERCEQLEEENQDLGQELEETKHERAEARKNGEGEYVLRVHWVNEYKELQQQLDSCKKELTRHQKLLKEIRGTDQPALKGWPINELIDNFLESTEPFECQECKDLHYEAVKLYESGEQLLKDIQHAIDIEPCIKDNSYKLKEAMNKYRKLISTEKFECPDCKRYRELIMKIHNEVRLTQHSNVDQLRLIEVNDLIEQFETEQSKRNPHDEVYWSEEQQKEHENKAESTENKSEGDKCIICGKKRVKGDALLSSCPDHPYQEEINYANERLEKEHPEEK